MIFFCFRSRLLTVADGKKNDSEPRSVENVLINQYDGRNSIVSVCNRKINPSAVFHRELSSSFSSIFLFFLFFILAEYKKKLYTYKN